MEIIKRDGRKVQFDKNKIISAILKAFAEVEGAPSEYAYEKANNIANFIETKSLENELTVEQIQDYVETGLMGTKAKDVARAYILYRNEHYKERLKKEKTLDFLANKFNDITTKGKESEVTKGSSGNANVDTESAMGKMLSYGAEFSKTMALEHLLAPEFAEAHKNGDIHIHDLDFYPTKTLTCCQIDLEKLFENGFSTGHGHQRKPQSIRSYAALAAIALQSNQNEQHGGQSIPVFDYYMAPGVLKTFRKIFFKNLLYCFDDRFVEIEEDFVKDKVNNLNSIEFSIDDFVVSLREELTIPIAYDTYFTPVEKAYERSIEETDKETYQAMEALIHNLNTMHSRAGAQVPFTSVNYGTDTSPEGRMVIKNLLLATEAGLGNGETPIFPIQIFKLKERVSYYSEDPNYDLFELACRVSAKRLFPNFSFLDSPFNLQYYRPGHPESEATYMGCRTRVIGNNCGEETVTGRGNLSFTSINLPRLAIYAKQKFPNEENREDRIDYFFGQLKDRMYLCKDQLIERLMYQATATVDNFPFLMGEGIWRGSENLKPHDKIPMDVLKQGTLSIGFIGLAETLKELIGVHHGESAEAQILGLTIVKIMRDFCDEQSEKTNLNITLLATPAEGLSGRFVRMDRELFGKIPGVTDRDYYTNSFHVPVYYNIKAFDKIKKEAPYHTMTNAGHISYIELDGDASKNLDAFMAIVRAEHDAGMGYASVNHPVDRDHVCGYTGIIDDECPKCGRKESEDGIPFERIRRITGYLVGTMDKWNAAKAAEERERVKHQI